MIRAWGAWRGAPLEDHLAGWTGGLLFLLWWNIENVLFPCAFSPGQGRAGTRVTQGSRMSRGHGFTLEVAQVMAPHAQGMRLWHWVSHRCARPAGSHDLGLESG